MVVLRTGLEVYDVEGIKFTVRPQEYQDFAIAMNFTNQLDLGTNELESMPEDDTPEEEQKVKAMSNPKNLLTGWSCLMERIVAWEGVESAPGEPAPCTSSNKRTLFAQMPNLLRQLNEQIVEREKVEEKNSETSQDG